MSRVWRMNASIAAQSSRCRAVIRRDRRRPRSPLPRPGGSRRGRSGSARRARRRRERASSASASARAHTPRRSVSVEHRQLDRDVARGERHRGVVRCDDRDRPGVQAQRLCRDVATRTLVERRPRRGSRCTARGPRGARAAATVRSAATNASTVRGRASASITATSRPATRGERRQQRPAAAAGPSAHDDPRRAGDRLRERRARRGERRPVGCRACSART